MKLPFTGAVSNVVAAAVVAVVVVPVVVFVAIVTTGVVVYVEKQKPVDRSCHLHKETSYFVRSLSAVNTNYLKLKRAMLLLKEIDPYLLQSSK